MAPDTIMTKTAITPPVLTFPPNVADCVRRHYDAADVILEYGSGGSTVFAAGLEGKTVFSVESDAKWIAGMEEYFAQAGLLSKVTFHRVNIGKTGKWGKPLNDKAWRRYHRYPLEVWDRDDFVAPDLVLIDGRCRAACLVTVMLRTPKPVTVLFDDYAGRRQYSRVERWIKPVEMIDRMARFEVTPTDLPKDSLTDLIGLFTKTF